MKKLIGILLVLLTFQSKGQDLKIVSGAQYMTYSDSTVAQFILSIEKKHYKALIKTPDLAIILVKYRKYDVIYITNPDGFIISVSEVHKNGKLFSYNLEEYF